MTYYEAIRNMNPKQMAYAFYAMLLPFMEDYTEEECKAAYVEIAETLMEEVKENA